MKTVMSKFGPIILGGVIGALVLAPMLLLAQAPTAVYEDVATAYRQELFITPPTLPAPSVIEVPLPVTTDSRTQFAVFETASQRFIPWQLQQTNEPKEIRVAVDSMPANAAATKIIDQDLSSYVEFPAGESVANQVVLILYTAEPVTTSALSLSLPPYVAQPLTSAVRAGMAANSLTPVVVERRHSGPLIQFPEVTAQVFEVTLTHIQPLRVSDLAVMPKNTNAISDRTVSLRFLAQPDSRYEIFANPDRDVPITLPESGDLRTSQNVLRIDVANSTSNPRYVPADVDVDGVPDVTDNCTNRFNPDQQDINSNGRGDVCDDFDRDGVVNADDNCINQPNVRQADEDGDGIGDACDTEESRFTEKNPWIPWVGIGLAGLTILALFAVVALGKKSEAPTGEQG